LKILVLANAFPPNVIGGGELSAFNLSRALARKGHEVSVLTMAEPEEAEVWNQPTPHGFKIFRLHFPHDYTPYKANKGSFKATWLQSKIWNFENIFDPRGPAIVKRVLDKVNPDHINIHTLPGFGLSTLSLFGRLDKRVLWVLHDLTLACAKGSMFKNGHTCPNQCLKCKGFSALHAYFIGKVRRLAFVSPSRVNLETVQRNNKAVGAKLGFAIPNVSDPLPSAMPLYAPDPNGVIRLLFVGRLHNSKGLDVLLEALTPLASIYRFKLTILGRGPMEEELKARYGAEPWVDFAGFVGQDDVTRAVAAHDILCTPSLWAEPYGRVTAQAIQLGTPVLGSASGGTTEIVRHEKTGLLLEAGNVEVWRKALARIFQTPSLLQTWRVNTAQDAARYTEAAIVAQYEAVIEQIRTL